MISALPLKKRCRRIHLTGRISDFETIFPGASASRWCPVDTACQSPLKETALIRSDRESFNEICLLGGIPVEWMDQLQEALSLIRSIRDLRGVYCRSVELFLGSDSLYDAKYFRYWPDPEAAMGDKAPLFYLLLALECIPIIRALHLSRNIPDQISRATCGGIGSKAMDYEFIHNEPGMRKLSIYWFKKYMRGEVYRCGRLEFNCISSPLAVYEHPESRERRILLKSPEHGEWISPSEDGRGELPLNPAFFRDWNSLLETGDKVLEVHIPGGGGLTLDLVRDSFERGLAFFDSLFPLWDIRGVLCESWIVSPDLEEVYPPDSNLVHLKQRVQLYPVETEDVEGTGFIFGSGLENAPHWPQKTSIQRRLKEHILGGGRFRLAGMILLRDEMNRL